MHAPRLARIRLIPALCCLLLPVATLAQDDPIGLKCMQTKLKSAGRGCQCVHRAWGKAIKTGELPDLSRCNDKLEEAFLKSESRATAAGGACYAGATVDAVKDSLSAATDRTLTQVGRGTFGPAPLTCDSGDHYDMTYSGGDYSSAMKCVKFQGGETTCDGPLTKAKLEEAIANDVDCPDLCTDGEEGCIPIVTVSSLNIRERTGFCCLFRDSNDTKNSLAASVVCSTCFTP